jgi:hypothetical protein
MTISRAIEPPQASPVAAVTGPIDLRLHRLLQLTGAGPDQSISLAGPGGLDLMVSLCRAGHNRVECARQATSAEADETSDLLILTGPAADLGALTARTAALLRDGGVLAAWLDRVEDDAAIRTALLVLGMEITTSTLVVAGGLVVIHRVWRSRVLAHAV